MKAVSMFKAALVATAVCLSSCGTHKKVVETAAKVQEETPQQREFMQKVSDNAQYTQFITSKIKFKVKLGVQEVSLTGNLKMKRNDVIRMQLMAFGFVEAARVEFTKDYIMIIDRINKQFIRAPYSRLEFLRKSGIDFYCLQSLFWNELFQPGKSQLSDEDLKTFTTDMSDNDVIIGYENDPLAFKWLSEKKSGLLTMANVLYRDKANGNSSLNWAYKGFKQFGNKQFPTNMTMTLTTPAKSFDMSLTLNYLGSDSDWETRTTVSGNYKEVAVEDIMKKFMAL